MSILPPSLLHFPLQPSAVNLYVSVLVSYSLFHYQRLDWNIILLPSYEDYGTDFLHHLRGEFAVIIWDDRKKRMLMARDRFGIKPLYYTTVNGVFMAASEIKAFSALGWRPEWVRREKFASASPWRN